MAIVYYKSSIADYIILEFTCACGHTHNTGLLPVRERYDNNKDVISFLYTINCSKCHKVYTVHFYDDMYKSYCEIPELDNESVKFLHEIPFEYAKDFNTAFGDYIEELVRIKGFLNDMNNQDCLNKELLYRMALIYAISIMDAYLGNTFRYYVKHFTVYKNKYCQYVANGNKTNIKQIFKKLERQSFQNLEIANKFYNGTFGITLPQDDVIQMATKTRNQIIHNNGKEKDGFNIIISEKELRELITSIESLVRFVNNQLIDTWTKYIVDDCG